jgi:competence ComEA-like helix-hairpin-helix protein
MADGYFERGEVYWVKMGMGVGCEINVTRPGLIVSANEMNNKSPSVLVVFLTTKEHRVSWNSIPVVATGKESWVLCDQIQTVDKSRFAAHLGTLSKAEMRAVEDALEKVFDLGYVDDTEEAEIERLKKEVTKLEAQVACKDESVIARGKEVANLTAKYNKAVDRIVELELDRDIASRICEKKAGLIAEKEEQPVVETGKAPVEPKKEFVRGMTNVNTASAVEISEKLGVSMNVAYSITGYRKKNGLFVDVEELKDVPRITKPMFERIKDYVVIGEPEVTGETEPTVSEGRKNIERVNINTASPRELMAVGFSKEVAHRIVYHQKNRVPFKSIDELLEIDGVKTRDIRKLRDKLEVLSGMFGFAKWFSLILCWISIAVNIWMLWRNQRTYKALVAACEFYEKQMKENSNDT